MRDKKNDSSGTLRIMHQKRIALNRRLKILERRRGWGGGPIAIAYENQLYVSSRGVSQGPNRLLHTGGWGGSLAWSFLLTHFGYSHKELVSLRLRRAVGIRRVEEIMDTHKHLLDRNRRPPALVLV